MIGLGGQGVFIVPALDLVVVNAGIHKSNLQFTLPFEILDRFVLEATAPAP